MLKSRYLRRELLYLTAPMGERKFVPFECLMSASCGEFCERRSAIVSDENFLSPVEISNLLNICYQNALSFIKYSGIHYIKVGRAYRVKREVLDNFLSEHQDINISEFNY